MRPPTPLGRKENIFTPLYFLYSSTRKWESIKKDITSGRNWVVPSLNYLKHKTLFFSDELPSFLATSFCHREEWKDCWLLNVLRWPWKVFAITNKYRANKIKFTLQSEPPWDSHSLFCSASPPLRLLSLYTEDEFAKRRVLVGIRDILKNGAKKELCLLEES